LRNARAFPLLPAALASVPFGFVLVRVRVRGVQESAGKRKREDPCIAMILAIGFKAIQGSLAVKLLGVLCKELQRY